MNRTRGTFQVWRLSFWLGANVRAADVINALTFSPFAGGPITMDHENTVKAYSASASMLGRGHSLFEPQGPVWVSRNF